MQHSIKRLGIWAIGIVAILAVPLVLTLRGSGVDGEGLHWTLGDFIFAFGLLFGAALIYELAARHMANAAYKFAVGLAVVTALVLTWVNAAVGIIGSEDNPANLMYFGVLAIGLIGAALARLQPRGMAYALAAMAIAQLAIPLIALGIWKPDFAPGAVEVFGLNAFFALLFCESALLFRRASVDLPLPQ